MFDILRAMARRYLKPSASLDSRASSPSGSGPLTNPAAREPGSKSKIGSHQQLREQGTERSRKKALSSRDKAKGRSRSRAKIVCRFHDRRVTVSTADIALERQRV
jgi:hypothetical protein